MKSQRPHSPNPLTVLVFGMLMGAFTVGLWVWLLEPGGYRQRYSAAANKEIVSAHPANADSDQSLESAQSFFEAEESAVDTKVRSLQATRNVPEADEKSSAPVLHKKPASKPSAYSSGDVLWSGRRRHVEAWAILPQAVNHLPPPDLMTEFWSRAVVTQYGGVVLLGSGHFATWDFETPGKSERLLTPAGILKLASTPSEALALDTQHRVWEISIRSHPALLPIQDGCGDLFYSGREGEALVSLQSGELMILNLGHPKRHRLISSPPGAGAMNAVLTEDGSVWVASKGLWKLLPGSVAWERVSDTDGILSAMGDGVILLDHGSLKSEGDAEQPPLLPHVEVMRSVTGIGASLHDDANITVWGSLLKGETRLVRTLLNPNQIALGPTGVLVAW